MSRRVALINRLEPLDLIRGFQSHPPEGFTSIEFCAPAFATRFDLLTTLEPAVRRRLRALPLPHPMTCFVGTTVSEYAPFPAETAPEELVRAIVDQFAARYAFVIIKDIPAEPTLVGEEALAYSRRVADACRTAGFALLDGQALAYVPIDFDSIDDFIGRFSHSRRKNLRRKLRRRSSIDVEAMA